MLAPETILQDRYRIGEPLGRGGMGAVYLATDLRFGSTVALKETLCEGDDLRRAFEREARLLNTLRHRALPVVTDYFTDACGQFLVMQYIPGDDLATLLAARGGPFEPAVVLQWAEQLLDALTYLHECDPQVIHRDIKPRNLKLTPRGEVVLLDFGISKTATRDPNGEGASVSVLGYTPHYAPFEQIQGKGTDPRSDLYALAATLYHLVTAEQPPDAMTRAQATMDGQADPLRPASVVNPAVPAILDAVLRQTMAMSRDERPASAAVMRAALQGVPVPVAPARTATATISGRATVVASAAPSTTTGAPPRSSPRGIGKWAALAAALAVTAALGLPRLTRLAALSTSTDERAGAAGAPAAIEPLAVSTVPPAERTFSFAAATVAANGSVGTQRTLQARTFEEDLGQDADIEMVAVPGGTFLMGDVDGGAEYEDEKPQHPVMIAPFYLSRYEVTQAQWRAVATGLPRVRRDLDPDPSRFKGRDLPVEHVSWEDAVEFAARVSRKAQRHYRLPSEAEWEYAARAGTTTAFAFGDTLTAELANYDASVAFAAEKPAPPRGTTTAVGSFPATNAFGLADVHGNVMEWCAGEYHGDYEGAPADGSPWIAGGDVERRVVRGGAWNSLAVDCRSANRYSYAQDGRRDSIGFRIAMSQPSAGVPRIAATSIAERTEGGAALNAAGMALPRPELREGDSRPESDGRLRRARGGPMPPLDRPRGTRRLHASPPPDAEQKKRVGQ